MYECNHDRNLQSEQGKDSNYSGNEFGDTRTVASDCNSENKRNFHASEMDPLSGTRKEISVLRMDPGLVVLVTKPTTGGLCSQHFSPEPNDRPCYALCLSQDRAIRDDLFRRPLNRPAIHV